jgi:regulator of sirC expression with transglutaminase-like and TPR domain
LETPEIDAKPVRQALDRFGAAARQRLGAATHPRFAAAAVSQVLFFEQKFKSPSENEETPEAAMIDQALVSRVATPALLAILFIETARRAGLRFGAVALPGRYLLRQDLGDQIHLFDLQNAGRPIDLEQCKKIVAESSGNRVEFREGLLRPLTHAQLLARLLAYVKALYWRARRHETALTTVRMLLAIRPDDPREIRDLGRLFYLLDRLPEAIQAFESYLQHNPRGEDAEAVRELLKDARMSLAP